MSITISECATALSLPATAQSGYLPQPHVQDYSRSHIPPVHGPLHCSAASEADTPVNFVLEDLASDVQVLLAERSGSRWRWRGPLIPRAIAPLPTRALATLAGVEIGDNTMKAISHDVVPTPLNPDMQLEDDVDGCLHLDDEDSDIECEYCTLGRKVNVFQSITATPGVSAWSFEELRAECYSQSLVATGSAPRAVPQGAPSWMVIPPAFVARSVPA
ncbi:hypothetical protein BV22DRAFT_1041231 [Leucogyrophana mollusca]|uniref:Uncharacterized protein n=1 Tax=Leucogyrophana mollusca TaxID=85980 RepID=A0ACB8B100_9AGAM|nr:hypothetical protein BV22DRAFT_1041231 [Leucogyrophana mollusca]